MTPSFQLDTSEFQRAAKECALRSNRELSKAITARLFFLFVRVFALLPPQGMNAARARIRAMLSRPVGEARISTKTGKRVSRARTLQSVHLIVQARRAKEGQPGLYGDAMKKAAAALRRRAIGSVGYLKSPVVKALKQLNGHFSQLGSKFKIGRRAGMEGYSVASPRQVGGVNQTINKYGKTQANAALIKVLAEYGIAADGNVGIHRGAKATATPARPGINPTATASLSIGLADDQIGKVSSIYNAVMSRAMADEIREIQNHFAAVGQSVADEFNA